MGDTKIKLIVNDDGTIKVVGDLKDKFKGVGDEAEKTSTRATRAMDALKTAGIATAAAVGAALTATTVAVGRQFQQIDELAKVSRATGVAVRDLSGLQVAADLAGVSLQGLGTSLNLFSRKIVEAQSGGRSAKLFEALGIDVSSGRSTQQLLEDVADGIAQMGGGAERTNVALELFGRSGARMINLLEGGGEAIRAAREEAELFGLVIGKDTSDAVEQVNDDLSRLQSVAVGFTRDLVEALAPALSEVSQEAVGWAAANREIVAADLAEYLTNLGPVIRTVADGFIFANSILDEFAQGVANLIGTGNVYASSEIAQQVARRLQSRGMGAGDLEMPGLMTPADGSGAVAAEVEQVARGEEKITETVRTRAEILERVRASMRELSAGGGGGSGGGGGAAGYGPGVMPLPFVAGIEAARGEIELMAAEAALVPGVVQDWTQEFERAGVAAVRFGDLFADSIVSAVDNLIASGDFNLADVFESTGKAAMSRMVGAMVREAGVGMDQILATFAGGFRSIGSGAANLGSVINGSLAVNGLGSFGDTGYGMSVDAMNYGGMSTMDGGTALMSGGAPLAQSAAGASGGFFGPGMLSAIGVGGTLGLGALAGGLAGGGLFGRRAQSNAGLFGGMTAAAIAAPFTFGLAPLFMALFGNKAPSASERRRMAMGEAFRDSGIFPSLAFARDPPREFLDAPMPGFLGDITPEVSALSLLLGGTMNDSMFRLPGTIGSRASVLGLSREQTQRELRRVAQSSGVSLDEAVGDLSTRFLEYQINGKGSAISQDDYLTLLTGTVDLLASDLPRGVDASVVALANLERVGGQTVLNLEAFNDELERQTQVAGGISSGITGAFGGAATGILNRSDTAGSDFARGIFDAAVGGIGQNLLTSLFADGGVLANFESSFVTAILGGNPEDIEAVMSRTPELFGLINEKLGEFLPVLDKFRQEVEDATGATAQGFRDQRSDLKQRIRDAKMATMTPMEQEAEYLRQIGADRGILGGLLEDGQITEDERAQFNKVNPRLIENSFALLGLRGNYAEGSVQQRRIDSTAFGALELADTALEIAASSIVVGDMAVTSMTVDKIIVSQQAAQALVGG